MLGSIPKVDLSDEAIASWIDQLPRLYAESERIPLFDTKMTIQTILVVLANTIVELQEKRKIP